MTSRAEIRGARGEAGFTLFELVIVFIIFGMVLAMMVGRINGPSSTLTLRAAANEIAAGLREARSAAIAGNKPASIAIDGSHHLWRAVDGTIRDLPSTSSVAIRSLGGSTQIPASAIRFESDGSSAGGHIELADGKRRVDIGIDWITGRVTVADAR